MLSLVRTCAQSASIRTSCARPDQSGLGICYSRMPKDIQQLQTHYLKLSYLKLLLKSNSVNICLVCYMYFTFLLLISQTSNSGPLNFQIKRVDAINHRPRLGPSCASASPAPCYLLLFTDCKMANALLVLRGIISCEYEVLFLVERIISVCHFFFFFIFNLKKLFKCI